MISAATAQDDRGITLFEVLMAIVMVALLATGVANLFIVSLTATRDARDETTATTLAVQKIEQLRAAAWGSAALASSPSGTLETSLPGFSDLVDGLGRNTESGAPPSALYVRRWSVQSLPSTPDGVVLRVLVLAARRGLAPGALDHADILISTVRTAR